MINLSSFIQYQARKRGGREALICGDARISYSEFLARLLGMAGWLRNQGLREGDVVAVLMKNSPTFLDVAFAASHVGAVFLPINFRLSRSEVKYIVEDARAKLLFVDEELLDAVDCDVQVQSLDTALQRDSRLLTCGAEPPSMAACGPADLYRLMYTSGTTDHPKGVLHSYGNFYWKTLAHIVELGLTDATRVLVPGPLYHVGPFDLPGVAVLAVGGALCFHRDFDAGAVLQSIETHRLNGATLVPFMTTALLGHPDRKRFDVSGLRWVVGGGERTPESRIRAFTDYFTRGRYIDAYGLTETCSGDTFMEAGRELDKIGSAGRPTLHLELEIRNDDGNALPAGEVGEVCLRGPKVTRGYWNDPEKTRASFFGDWLRTGDVGYVDDEGFLYLTDRKKDMIISGGENIASSEVERVVQELPQIREAAVIAVPDSRWGEVPVAVVALEKHGSLDLDTLRSHCQGKLASFKVPKQLLVRDALPRNASGKILKRQLREELAARSAPGPA